MGCCMMRSTTAVANAYTDDIYVKIDTERSYVTAANFTMSNGTAMNMLGVGEAENEVAVSGAIDLDWNKIQVGCTAIKSRTFLTFRPPLSHGHTTVYLTVFLGGKNGKCVAAAWQLEKNKNIIVSRDGYVRRAKKGKIWVDELGNRYNTWGTGTNASSKVAPESKILVKMY